MEAPCQIGADHMIKATDLLIAPPDLPDSRFEQSVIIMLNHSQEQGSLGLCVNRPLTMTVKDLNLNLSHDRYMDFPMYWGGPVNRNTVWMLHSSEWALDDTVELSDQWSMTSSIHMFEALADGFLAREFRLFSGFCSWAPSQLDMELSGQHPWNPRHSWLVATSPDPTWLFEQPVDRLWNKATTLSCHQAVDSWLT